eukprot:6227593-Prymnesium_polylepis.1
MMPNCPQRQQLETVAAAEAEAGQLCIRRDLTPGNEPEFDGSDGWAVVSGLYISMAKEWYRNEIQHVTLGWRECGSWGNELNYLLNRRTNDYHMEAASFLESKMGNTAMGSPANWLSVPECLIDVDRQLREVLVDPRFGSEDSRLSLLGHTRRLRRVVTTLITSEMV